MPKKPSSPSLADQQPAAGGTAAVDRALSILAVFRTGDAALPLTEIARRTRLYMSTALRLITSLEHGGLLRRQEDGRYALGPEVARLHAVYIASFALDSLVLPVLRKLVEVTGESAAFHVRQGNQRLCLYRVNSPHILRDHTSVGDLLPLDHGAGGRVLAACAGAEGAIYAKIRRDRLTVLRNDRVPGVAGIAAPVFDARGDCIGAISLSMPVARLQKRYENIVDAAARSLTTALGYSSA